MTRVTSFDATLDTCVLFPITLCDTLLRLAEDGFYRPHWSQETLDELARNLVKKAHLTPDAAQKRIDHMTAAFPEALVDGYQRLVSVMPNQRNDRHVLAAAIRSGSQVIVTINLRHFPADQLNEFDLEAQPPDIFLLHQSALDPKATVAVLRRQASEKSRPPTNIEELLGRLDVNAPTFAHAMRLLLDLPAQGELVLPTSAALAPLADELAAVRGRGRQGS